MEMKTVLGIIGLILTISGWFISNAEEMNWVIRLLAPKYIVAVEAYENMIKNKSTIEEGSPGFQEIAEILSEKLHGSGDLTISKIHIIDHAFSFKSYDTGMKSVPTITIEITLNDGRKTQASGVEDLRPELKKRYLKSSIFKYGAVVFWLGIFLVLTSLLVGQKIKRRKE